MRLRFFLLSFLCIHYILLSAQTISSSGANVSVNTAGAPYPVITKTASKSLSAAQNRSKRITVWLEAGDGFFTTNPSETHALQGAVSHNALMLAAKIYDTTLGLSPTNIVTAPAGSSSSIFKPSFTTMLGNFGIKLSANVPDIVAKDPMAFAITYKTPLQETTKNGVTLFDPAKKFKIYFLYNNNTAFNVISNQAKLSGTNVNNMRCHYGETFLSANTVLPNTLINTTSCANWVCFDIPNNTDFEKTIFVSLKPKDSLEIGKSGSVYAVLTDELSQTILARDSITNMLFSLAHDPNYIVQRPYCIKLPKKGYPFEYTVHFQNTGKGDAIGARVEIHLPKGLDYGKLQIKKIEFADVDYTAMLGADTNFFIDKVKNIIRVNFEKSKLTSNLLGTDNSKSPATDPKTMGEIQFSLPSTPNTDDSLKAHADIFFQNVDGSWNDTVQTNTANTFYKECCRCKESSTGNTKSVKEADDGEEEKSASDCHKILGLCWWWWVIIALILIILWLITTRKKQNKNLNNQY